MTALTYDTSNDLPEKARAQVADLLNQRLADAIDLATQAKQAHWNVKGPQFIALHKLFDEVHDAVQEYVDLLAERSELTGYPRAIADGAEHVNALAGALAEFGTRIRRAIDQTDDLGDQGSADICTEISRGVDKWLWFVEAHVQAGSRAGVAR